MVERVRYKLLRLMIRFWHWLDSLGENLPHYRQHSPIFFAPAILIPLAISAASFGAQMIISRVLAPKPKAQVKGKLTGEIQLTDSIFGAPIARVYGGQSDAITGPAGVEVGTNIFWMSDIRVIRTEDPGGTGGGKGGPDPPPNVRINYKVDIAGIIGAGRLRLLRMKWNEDTIYNRIGFPIGPIPNGVIYEAEDPGNTLQGTATVAADTDCSGDEKVTGLGGTGVLIFNDIPGDWTPPVAENPELVPPEPGVEVPYFEFFVHYKSATTATCKVLLNSATTGDYVFPATTGSEIGKVFIRKRVPTTGSTHTFKFTAPAAIDLEVDCLDLTVVWLPIGSGPTGVRNEDFPAEDAQDNLLLPNPYEQDTNAYERFNAQPPDPTNGYTEIPLPNSASLGWYEGTADQPIDALIEASVGVDVTPAFRDTSFFRLTNMDFSKYGTIPVIRCVVENMDLKTVEEILLYEGTHGGAASGLTTADFDLTEAAAKHVRGFVIADTEAPAKAFEELGMWFNLAFAESHDGKVTAIDLSDRTVAATIPREDLGAYISDESDEVPLDDVISTVPEEAEDLIRTLELQWNNPYSPSDYNTDRRRFNYPHTASLRKEVRSANITALPDEAAAVLRRELQRHHLKQAPERFIVPHKYAALNAGDCIELEVEGQLHLRRIEEKTGTAPGTYEITATNEEIYVLADDGDVIEDVTVPVEQSKVPSRSSYPAVSVGTIMDLPPLRSFDKGLSGVYVAACPRGQGAWNGCQVLRNKGVGYAPVATLTKAASMGVVVDELPGLPEEGGEVVDPGAVLTVDFFGDFNPTTVTTGQAEDGANCYLIGSEVAVVQDWTRDNDYPNRWVGTSIYRALRNTTAAAEEHEAGERVVLLNQAVQFVPLDRSEIGVERSWKFVTYGGEPADTPEIVFTWRGENAGSTAAEQVFGFSDSRTSTTAWERLYGGGTPRHCWDNDGDVLRMGWAVAFAANGNDKSIKVELDGTEILPAVTVQNNGGHGWIDIEIMRDSATSVRTLVRMTFADPVAGSVTGLEFGQNMILGLFAMSDADGDLTARFGYAERLTRNVDSEDLIIDDDDFFIIDDDSTNLSDGA